MLPFWLDLAPSQDTCLEQQLAPHRFGHPHLTACQRNGRDG